MKKMLPILISLLSLTTLGQQISPQDWDEQAKDNIRLLPKYGHKPKTDEQKQADRKFITETMNDKQFGGDRRAASNDLIRLGFDYLYHENIKTAMYRFNQAFLLDSLNPDIYWGYGAVYMTLRKYQDAKKQYQQGLFSDPQSTHLLTDYGTCYMVLLQQVSMNKRLAVPDRKAAGRVMMDSALLCFNKSYKLDPKDQNTTFKLSAAYLRNADCTNAWRYYNECMALGGKPIPVTYAKELTARCAEQR